LRKKHIQVLLRLDEKEKAVLDKKCKKAGCNLSVFLRNCILDKDIKEQKSADYFKLYREINAIGNNINQVARSVNVGMINPSDITYLKQKMDDIYDVLEHI
jgi:hypothetical protein